MITEGWKCPDCDQIYSPKVLECYDCNEPPQVIYPDNRTRLYVNEFTGSDGNSGNDPRRPFATMRMALDHADADTLILVNTDSPVRL